MNVSRLILIIIPIFTIISCQADSDPALESEEEIQEAIYNNVDERLWLYFQEFESQATQRGLSFDLNDFGTTGEISGIHEDGVAGTCQYGTHINHVTVDIDYWNRANNLQREFVIFHELGHCVLGRDHEEGAFNNGICISIMRSGLGDCNDAYINQNRDYFIDELFSQEGP